MIKGKEFILMVRALSHEKDIPEKEIFEAVEKALAIAVRKQISNEAEIKVTIDTIKGDFHISRFPPRTSLSSGTPQGVEC